MKIKRFLENSTQTSKNEVQGPQGVTSVYNEISSEKLDEIINELVNTKTLFDDKLKKLKQIEKDLSKFKSNSKTKIYQIDESYLQIQSINKSIEEDIDSKIKEMIVSLKDRKENGNKSKD